MTPRPEAIPKPTSDQADADVSEPSGVSAEIADVRPAPAVRGSVRRLAAFSSRTGRWQRPAAWRRQAPGAESRDGRVD
jgi:hypothetical protein